MGRDLAEEDTAQECCEPWAGDQRGVWCMGCDTQCEHRDHVQSASPRTHLLGGVCTLGPFLHSCPCCPC